MKITAGLENIDSIEATITITMNLGEWKILNDKLDITYPSYRLSSAISEMLIKAREEYSKKIERV